ncbi:MAG: GWxTD domain-containing protein [Ignavibacteria bacterium]|nr:GWxTD domain-containing protein [Ignavibacteria bacterium]
MMIVRTVLVLISLISATALYSQQKRSSSKKPQMIYGDACYADAVVLPHSDNDSAYVDVLLRCNMASLVFSKVNSYTENRGNYYAALNLSIEARDAIGVVRQRVRYSDTVFMAAYENLADSTSYHYGSVRLALASGSYTIAIDESSGSANMFQKIILPKVNIPKGTQTNGGQISCTFATAISKEYDTLVPIVFNGQLRFPVERIAILATVPRQEFATYDVWIRQQPYQDDDIRWWSGVTIRTSAAVSGVQIKPLNTTTYVVDTSVINSRTLVIPILGNELVPGRYLLTIVADGKRDTLRYPFTVQWESMPYALRSLSYALEVLAYICPEETLDSLQSGDDALQRESLMDWWRKQDRSYGTAHNERMTEYYRRVDRASYDYATLKEQDGAFTDRGKVYILYGAPTKVERKSDKTGQAIETWIYNNSVKTLFVFNADKSGSYKLITVQPLKK